MLRNLAVILSMLIFAVACQTKPVDVSGAGAAGESADGVVKPGTQQDLEANVGDRVFFPFDKSNIDDQAKSTLDRQVAWLNANPSVKLMVEGHADARGTREYNLGLGERRANNVKNYLTSAGIDSARLSTISYGKERPAVLGEGEEVWRQNRRGVSVVQQ